MARVAKITKTVPVSEVSSEAAPKQKRTLPVIVVLTMLLCISIGVAGYFYYQYRNSAPVKDADEIASLTKLIGAFMELPDGETPTLATVTDKEKLADQPFFRKSENGDKVLIYTNSGRAILYRPSTKKIVDVTNVNVNQSATTAPAAPTPQPAEQSAPAPDESHATVALYNGSTKTGVTNTLEDGIKAAFSNVEVIAKEKAVRSDYQGDLVIDLSGKNAELAKKIAENFGGTVGTLPSGEAVPQADIMVIVGNK